MYCSLILSKKSKQPTLDPNLDKDVHCLFCVPSTIGIQPWDRVPHQEQVTSLGGVWCWSITCCQSPSLHVQGQSLCLSRQVQQLALLSSSQTCTSLDPQSNSAVCFPCTLCHSMITSAVTGQVNGARKSSNFVMQLMIPAHCGFACDLQGSNKRCQQCW